MKTAIIPKPTIASNHPIVKSLLIKQTWLWTNNKSTSHRNHYLGKLRLTWRKLKIRSLPSRMLAATTKSIRLTLTLIALLPFLQAWLVKLNR